MRKTALVTGASRGLGRVIATFLARSGYDLVLTARRTRDLTAVAHELRKEGVYVTAVAGDVTGAAHRRRLAAEVAELAAVHPNGTASGLDVLVNNASELGPSPMPELASYDLDALRGVFEANLVAPIALVQELLPALRARGGLVVNITSDAAVGAYENWGGYGASKAALELASRTLAAEIRPMGVGVVVVDPGDMRTDMHQAAFPGEDISDRPLPDVTIPFWAWLFATDYLAVSGSRFQAQAERWDVVTSLEAVTP